MCRSAVARGSSRERTSFCTARVRARSLSRFTVSVWVAVPRRALRATRSRGGAAAPLRVRHAPPAGPPEREGARPPPGPPPPPRQLEGIPVEPPPLGAGEVEVLHRSLGGDASAIEAHHPLIGQVQGH